MKKLLAAAALAAASTVAVAQMMGPGSGPRNPGPFPAAGTRNDQPLARPNARGMWPQGYGMHAGLPYGTVPWMLTREEFRAHLQAMLQLNSYEECVAYMEAHHAQLEQRARLHGQAWAPVPFGPICDYFGD